MLRSFRHAVTNARRHRGFYFAALLPEDYILQAMGDARRLWHGWLYTPAVTVWLFLSQCLSEDHSCRDAVACLLAWRVAHGQRACSSETGGYCIARSRLPEEACRSMVRAAGRRIEQNAPNDWRWRGRRVLVVDGSTVTMPDTPASQCEYPQPKSQKPGCGFPIARIVVVFSLATGVVLDAAIGKYKGKRTGENSMFRTLHQSVLAPGDVVLADRYFSGWFDIALLQMHDASVCVRKHQLRKDDFRTGRRLGSYDHVVVWAKPQRPKWMSKESYDAMPNELALREVRVVVKEKGFRTRHLVVVTTMLDADECPAEDVGELYRRRWRAELHLRSIKTVLQMDRLRSKTPERVRNEFWMHLLGYNLIRGVMAQAAIEAKTQPWRISFKGTLQTLSHFLPLLGSCPPDSWCDALLRAAASHVVGNRPGRHEPRLVKRRPKPYKYLQKPRRQYRSPYS
jgi:hypothetical protein